MKVYLSTKFFFLEINYKLTFILIKDLHHRKTDRKRSDFFLQLIIIIMISFRRKQENARDMTIEFIRKVLQNMISSKVV